MSYMIIADMTESRGLHRRLTACAAEQGVTNPAKWVQDNTWLLAVSPGWRGAWASALAVPDRPDGYDPGADEAVITDDDIRARVQPLVTT